MLQSFTVRDFRCFSELTIRPLARVNLIAGKNNTGKTALLEALHLFAYPRQVALAFKIKDQRNMREYPEHDREILAWLFKDRKREQGAEMMGESESGEQRTLSIRILDADVARQLPMDSAVQAQFNWLTGGSGTVTVMESEMQGRKDFAFASESGGVFKMLGVSEAAADGRCEFIGSMPASNLKESETFSELVVGKRLDEILPALQILEPRLKHLALVLLAGVITIHGELAGHDSLVPLPFMGEGIRRVLAIITAIAVSKGGKVLIDEVENGLHYSIMKDVWKAIARAARAADVQVFATTHSYECIQAAHEAFSESDAEDLRLLRLDRVKSGITVAAYDREVLEYALEMAHEVR